MTTLSELEKEYRIKQFEIFTGSSGTVAEYRAFNKGFEAGLQYQLERVKELEAKIAELQEKADYKAMYEHNTRIEFLEGQLTKTLHPSLEARYRQELAQLKS